MEELDVNGRLLFSIGSCRLSVGGTNLEEEPVLGVGYQATLVAPVHGEQEFLLSPVAGRRAEILAFPDGTRVFVYGKNGLVNVVVKNDVDKTVGEVSVQLASDGTIHVEDLGGSLEVLGGTLPPPPSRPWERVRAFLGV